MDNYACEAKEQRVDAVRPYFRRFTDRLGFFELALAARKTENLLPWKARHDRRFFIIRLDRQLRI